MKIDLTMRAGIFTTLMRCALSIAPARFFPRCCLPIWLTLLPVLLPAQFAFTTNNGTITITGYSGPGGVIIPDTINGLPVGAIDSYAFDAKNVTSVTMPDSVASIGTYAFRDCSSLTSVHIGAGVKSIGFGAFIECRNLTSVTLPPGLNDFQTYAFRGCSSLTTLTIPTNVTTIANSVFFQSGLTNIHIPKSVTSIGSSAFHPCRKLQAITVDPLNPVYTSVAGVLLNKPQTLLIQYPGGKAGAYSMSQSVTNIGPNAFSYCDELTDVTLSPNVTMLANQAFFSCPKLARITIPDRVLGIGSAAFAYCRGLTNVTFGTGTAGIGHRAFASCITLNEFTVDALNPYLSTEAGVLFDKNLRTLICYPGGKEGYYSIPNTVTNLVSSAFEASIHLTGVMLPPGLTSLPDSAFSSCTNLRSITIPKTITRLGDRAFVVCSSLTAVYFSGNAPQLLSSFVFYNANQAWIYYLPGTTGWTSTFGGRPATLWNPTPQTTQPNFGVKSNHFGFTITGTPNIPIVVEAPAHQTDAPWIPLQSGRLTNGSIYFRDFQWTNHPSRLYRIRSP